MDLLSSLNTRYATKVFDTTKQVSEEGLEKLLEAIRLSASSFGLQPYKVLVVTNPEIRAELRKASWGQPQITDSSALLVFAVKSTITTDTVDQFINLVAETRNAPKEALSEYQNMMNGTVGSRTPEQLENWASKQAYIALGFGLVSSAILGIDSCPMEGFSPEDYDRILELDKLGLKSKVVLAVGYRSEADKYQQYPKVRFSKEDFFVQI
ncbi:MAG: NAD(P)H-dependent oxidoreductase [Mariniphaga sp.]